jgi:hypothetical protein
VAPGDAAGRNGFNWTPCDTHTHTCVSRGKTPQRLDDSGVDDHMDTLSSTHATSPTTLATSQEIRDRGSTFVGYVYRARTADDARVALQHHAGAHTRTRKDGSEVYAIAAWRCMVVRPGRTGLGGPEEFVIEDGCEDGGERWAGGRVLGVMKREGAIDAVVVICRWCVVIASPSLRLPHRGWVRTYSWHACQVRRDVVGTSPVRPYRDLCERGVSQVQKDGGHGGVRSDVDNAG